MRILRAVGVLTAAALLATTAAGPGHATTPSSAAKCTPAWRLVKTPTPPGGDAAVLSVSAVSKNTALFSGWLPTPAAGFGSWPLRWNGHAVSAMPQVPPVPLGVQLAGGGSFDSSTDGWLATSRIPGSGVDAVERRHGGRWTLTNYAVSPNPLKLRVSISTVAAVSGTDGWAAGWYSHAPVQTVASGALIERWNGSQWTIVPNPASNRPRAAINAITVISPTNVWAVGQQGDSTGSIISPLAEHWNGKTWAVVTIPALAASAYPAALHAVSGSGPNDLWAVGDQTRAGTTNTAIPLAEHWNGKGWQVVKNLPDVGNSLLNSVYAANPQDVWVTEQVELQTPAVFLHWDGRKWSTVTVPGPKEYGLTYLYYGVDGTGPDDVWAVGEAFSTPNILDTPQIAHLSCG